MAASAKLASIEDTHELRTQFRKEMDCQIVHDSIHRREGWTKTYLLELNGFSVGFASMAVAGPWKDKPTVFEFYVLPSHRVHGFDLFEAFLATSGARFFEVQSNDALFTVMLHAYGREVVSEKIVYRDQTNTALPANGAVVKCVSSKKEITTAIEQRQGGGEWVVEVDGAVVGKGGILFHYNVPYGDIYLEIDEPFRRRGLGGYFIQELKCACRDLGAIPCARTDPANIASRRALQRSGFAPFAHILNAPVAIAKFSTVESIDKLLEPRGEETDLL